ncbi:MAG: glycosyltransferase [Nitrospirae bacterium]|nr:glycosyltransferase [Nitrospirota bacterium]
MAMEPPYMDDNPVVQVPSVSIPLVSIIVRTKDRPKMLMSALASIGSQSYRHIEVVLVNDGGEDISLDLVTDVLNGASSSDSDSGNIAVNYVNLPTNTGRAHAANIGLKYSGGQYVGFLDDDDEFQPDHVETLVSFLEKGDFHITYSDCSLNVKQFDPDKKEFITSESYKFFDEDFDYDLLLMENYIPLHCLMFERSALEGQTFDESFDLFEDWDFLIRVASRHPFHHVKKTTAIYNKWNVFSQITGLKELPEKSAYESIVKKHSDKINGRVLYHYWKKGISRRWNHIDAIRVIADRDGYIGKLNEETDYLKRTRDGSEKAHEEKFKKLSEENDELKRQVSQWQRRASESQRLTSQYDRLASQWQLRASEIERQVLESGRRVSELETINEEYVHRQTALENIKTSLEKQNSILERELTQSGAAIAEFDNIFNQIAGELNIANPNFPELESALIASMHKLTDLEKFYTIASNSFFWKIGLRFYSLRNRIIPDQTRRRKLYNLVKQGVYNLDKDLNVKYGTGSANRVSSTQILLRTKFSPISFTLTDTPEVSIIIPVYNKAMYTYNCLKSIHKNTTAGTYEVIVVNNSSTDNTRQVLGNINGLKTINNDKNLGFVHACNMGAMAAKGKYLMLLNNDTMVTTGWLDNLSKLFEKDETLGAAGSKLIYPDGTLQEAGGIIFSDGSGYNYGKSDKADAPAYNYLKEVDYVSGASLMIRKSAFESVGCLDTRYHPAYYEDVDLCFSLRKAGYTVVYQPKSVVVHFEGVTAGTDLSGGYKAYQEKNRYKFVEKWAGTLNGQHNSNGSLFLARERIRGQIIFMVNNYVPTYDKDAGSLRMFNIIRILLTMGAKIIYLPDNLAPLAPYTEQLQQMGVEVLFGAIDVRDYIKKFGKYIDIAFLCRPWESSRYIDLIRVYARGAKVIYDTIDLHYVREERRAAIENDPGALDNARNFKTMELSLCKKSDITIVVSETEKEILKKEVPHCKIHVLPLILDAVGSCTSFEKRKDIMFIGGFDHLPNVDGVIYFVNSILPLVLKQIPDIKLYVVGSKPKDSIMGLSSYNVIVTGYVEDVTSYFSNCRVFVSPLRYGAGVKGKIGQSMSFGLPVVTTQIGAEGLGLVNGINSIIADAACDFANGIVELYTNESLWYKLSKNGTEYVEKNFSMASSRKKIENVIESLKTTV